jgi:hypothetical protein
MHSRTAHCESCERETLQAKVFAISAGQLLWRCSECQKPVERAFQSGRTASTANARLNAARL